MANEALGNRQARVGILPDSFAFTPLRLRLQSLLSSLPRTVYLLQNGEKSLSSSMLLQHYERWIQSLPSVMFKR